MAAVGDIARTRPESRRVWVRAAVLVVLAFVLALCAGWGLWWWRHPEVFHPAPDVESLGLGEIRPVGGEALNVRMAHPLPEAEGAVKITGIEPRVVKNSAGARLTFHVCVPTSGGLGSVTGQLARWCSEVTDAVGATLPLHPGSWSQPQIVMTISDVTARGELRVQGIDLSYEYGRQSGTQRVGEYVWLRYR